MKYFDIFKTFISKHKSFEIEFQIKIKDQQETRKSEINQLIEKNKIDK